MKHLLLSKNPQYQEKSSYVTKSVVKKENINVYARWRDRASLSHTVKFGLKSTFKSSSSWKKGESRTMQVLTESMYEVPCKRSFNGIRM
jgi:hypothetical protein